MGQYRDLPRIQRLLTKHLESTRQRHLDAYNNGYGYTAHEAEEEFGELHPMLGQIRSSENADIRTPVTEDNARGMLFDLRANRDAGVDQSDKHFLGVHDLESAIVQRPRQGIRRFSGSAE